MFDLTNSRPVQKPQIKHFREFLQKKGIGEGSPNIPDENKRYKFGYAANELMFVPNLEEFPVENFDLPYQYPHSEIIQDFLKIQLQFVFHNKDSIDVLGTNVDIPKTFADINQFSKYKQEVSSILFQKNTEEGTDFQICHEPSCTHTAIPLFNYCLNHIEKDPNFESQKLIHKCNYYNCHNPAGLNQIRCSFHRNIK